MSFCTYCSHNLDKHNVMELGVECRVCEGVCGDWTGRFKKKTRKQVESMLKLVKDNL